jgi:hypothetical protein
MSDETINNKGPVCSCGRPDLYDEWLKQSETEKPTASSDETDKHVSPSDDDENSGQKPEKAKKN